MQNNARANRKLLNDDEHGGSLTQHQNDDPYNFHVRDSEHNKYRRELQSLKPIRFSKRNVGASIDSAGLISRVTFSWLSKIMYKKKIEFDDLPALSKHDSAESALDRLLRLQSQKKMTSSELPIKDTFYRFVRTRMIVSSFAVSLSVIASVVGPALVISRLIEFSAIPSPDINYGIALVSGLVFSEILRSFFFFLHWSISLRTASRIRAGIIALIYHKLIRLQSLDSVNAGELVNLIGNDSQRLVDLIHRIGYLLGAPILLIVATTFSLLIVGWTAIMGVLVILFLLPVQVAVGKQLAKARLNSVAVTDKRVRTMSEILTYIKLIKMYAWDDSFAKSVENLRRNEVKILTKASFLDSIILSIIPIVPVIGSVAVMLVHTLIGYPLTAAQAFTVLTIFNTLRIVTGMFPQAIKAAVEVSVSFQRIDDLLHLDERKPYYGSPTCDYVAVQLNDVTAEWKTELQQQEENCGSENSANSSENKNYQVPGVHEINFTIPKGRLVGVCGSFGSGKSSLISVITGQLHIDSGDLFLAGTIAYAPQQAWIFHDTARENILFGNPWNEEKYKRVVQVCSLAVDFESFPDKDFTEIGERGINLSGGQKQRISIARAVYSDRDIILLDDPLSAVDAHVGKHIFYECIKKALANKTVIFVTHQLQYLKDCDDVILLKDGKISEHGSHNELMKMNNEYAQLIEKFELNARTEEVKKAKRVNNVEISEKLAKKENGLRKIIDTNDNEDETDYEIGKKAEHNPRSLMSKETHEVGNVKAATYNAYIKAAGGYFVTLLVLFVFALAIGVVAANNWWLSFWLNAGGRILNSTSCSATNFSEQVSRNYQDLKSACNLFRQNSEYTPLPLWS